MKKYLLWSLLLGCSFFVKAQSINEEFNFDNKLMYVNESESNTIVCPLASFLSTANLLSTSIEFGWECSQQYATFELQYKPTSASTWTTVVNIDSDNDGFGRNNQRVLVNNLLPNTIYQWRVKTICGVGDASNYVDGTNFTTICPVTSFLSTANLLSTSIEFGWECSQQYATFELQYKPTSASTWTTVANIDSDNDGFGRNNQRVLVNNLLPNTTYQWRVKTICASGDPSLYMNGTNFTTICPVTSFLSTANLLSTSIEFGWECSQQYATFELQYKPTSASTWTTVVNIDSDNDGFGRNNQRVLVNNLLPNTIYQWRVKTICSSGDPSLYMNGTNFTTICPVTYFLGTNSLLSTSINMTWWCDQQYATFELQYKPTSSATWTTISNIQSDNDGYGRNNESVAVTNLLPNTTYQWRVKTICASGDPSVYVNGNNFTTLCAAPTGLGTGNTTLTTTDLIWLSVSAGINYEVRYRPQGTTTWTTQTVTAPSPTATSTIVYNITGLALQTVYEWQVRTICNPITTAFSSLSTFTTACPVPTTPNTTELAANSAKLNWSLGLPGTTSDLQWRLVGSNTWTTVTGLTTGTYTLTGLNVGTAYEWQVRTNCSVSVSSIYTTPITFTTVCPLPTNLSVANLLPNTVQFNWSGSYPAGIYSVQWKLQSASTFNTINNITATSYNLTGLTSGSAYVWQVKLACTPTVSTIYAGPNSFTTPALCLNMYTLKNGLWNDPSVWSCNRLPNNTDVVTIRNVITVPTGYNAQSQNIIYDQAPTIIFQQPTSLNLNNNTTPVSQNEFLKGTWAYPNGAELYYDGTSTFAKGTKIPDNINNSIYGFVIGEDYWQNLNFTSNVQWTVNQILRYPNGSKSYNPTIITKLTDYTIEIDIIGERKEILTRK